MIRSLSPYQGSVVLPPERQRHGVEEAIAVAVGPYRPQPSHRLPDQPAVGTKIQKIGAGVGLGGGRDLCILL